MIIYYVDEFINKIIREFSYIIENKLNYIISGKGTSKNIITLRTLKFLFTLFINVNPFLISLKQIYKTTDNIFNLYKLVLNTIEMLEKKYGDIPIVGGIVEKYKEIFLLKSIIEKNIKNIDKMFDYEVKNFIDGARKKTFFVDIKMNIKYKKFIFLIERGSLHSIPLQIISKSLYELDMTSEKLEYKILGKKIISNFKIEEE